MDFKKAAEEEAFKDGIGLAKGAAGAAKDAGLEALKDESRKVTVKLTNNTKQKWVNPRIFIDCGMAEDLLPLEVDDGDDVEYEIHKKKWRLTGIEGVISYEFTDEGTKYSLAVMFRSPSLSSNNWCATIHSETPVEATQQLFRSMTKETIKGDNNYTRKEFGKFTLQGAMSSSGTAKLNIIISTVPPPDPPDPQDPDTEEDTQVTTEPGADAEARAS